LTGVARERTIETMATLESILTEITSLRTAMDTRFTEVDGQFAKVGTEFERVHEELQRVDVKLNRLREDVHQIDRDFDRHMEVHRDLEEAIDALKKTFAGGSRPRRPRARR